MSNYGQNHAQVSIEEEKKQPKKNWKRIAINSASVFGFLLLVFLVIRNGWLLKSHDNKVMESFDGMRSLLLEIE